MRNRFEVDFRAGFTELLVHQSLKRLYSEVEVDPEVGPGGKRTPDFRVEEPNGQPVYVETTVVMEESEVDRGAERALAPFYDAINNTDIPDYFVGIHDVDVPRGRTPSARRFKRWLADWIASVDYDEMVRIAQQAWSFAALSRTFSDGESQLTVSLLPVSEEHRGSPDHRPIGVYPGSSRWGDSSPAIAKKITDKGNRYPDLGGPLVVVANVASKWMAGEEDALRALFGSDYERQISPIIPETNRVWCGPGGEIYTRISAVGFGTLHEATLASAELFIVLNPWGDPAYQSGGLLSLPHLLVRDGELIKVGGMALGELLDLEADWPGDLFDS